MSSSHAASLVNVTGFVAGTALYAMLLFMVVRPRGASQEGRSGIDILLVVTALLGLAWNLEAFVSNGLRDFGVPPLPRLAQAVAFASLGFLPAVVVHSVLRAGLSRLTSPGALVQLSPRIPSAVRGADSAGLRSAGARCAGRRLACSC